MVNNLLKRQWYFYVSCASVHFSLFWYVFIVLIWQSSNHCIKTFVFIVPKGILSVLVKISSLHLRARMLSVRRRDKQWIPLGIAVAT